MPRSRSSTPPPPSATARRALKSLRPETETFEMRAARSPRARRPHPDVPNPSKPRKRGLPSASISPRSNALRFSSSPSDLVGGVQLGKTRRRLRIGFISIGVQLLGELAVGGFDLRLARGFRNPQNLVGVAHCRSISKTGVECPPAGRSTPAVLASHVGFHRQRCNAPTLPPALQRSFLRALPGLQSAHLPIAARFLAGFALYQDCWS